MEQDGGEVSGGEPEPGQREPVRPCSCGAARGLLGKALGRRAEPPGVLREEGARPGLRERGNGCLQPGGAGSAGPLPPGRRVVALAGVAVRPASALPVAGLALGGVMGLTQAGWASASPSAP